MNDDDDIQEYERPWVWLPQDEKDFLVDGMPIHVRPDLLPHLMNLVNLVEKLIKEKNSK